MTGIDKTWIGPSDRITGSDRIIRSDHQMGLPDGITGWDHRMGSPDGITRSDHRIGSLDWVIDMDLS